MDFTLNELMVMLAIKGGATNTASVVAAIKSAWGLKIDPSSAHLTANKCVKSKDLKATRVKGPGRGTVTFEVTAVGEKRLAKVMAGFDSIRAGGVA